MSDRNTIVLEPGDLKYLLLDSLRLYSDNVIFLSGHNPYRIAVNGRPYNLLIRNVHSSGKGRTNPDESRVQISRSANLNAALATGEEVIVLGFSADFNVITAWDPTLLQRRFNQKQNVSVYSRFSTQARAASDKIAAYRDAEAQSVITFRPEYLGLYLENADNIHNLSDAELQELVGASDVLNDEDSPAASTMDFAREKLTITHTRYKRDPRFKKQIQVAYQDKCGVCGIQLGLDEAAHIVPHSDESGTDDVNNGINLCSLHHKAYDRALIYFDEEYNILVNENKAEYLRKTGKDAGLDKFKSLAFDKIQLPAERSQWPDPAKITLGNRIRGIE